MDPYNVVNRAVASKSDLKLLQGQVIAVHGRMLTVKLYDGIANHVPVIVSGIPKPGDVVYLLSDKGKLLCISPSSGALSLDMLDSRYVNPEMMSNFVIAAVNDRVLRSGDIMSGSLRLDSAKGLVLHSPGESVVSCRSVAVSGAYCFAPVMGWSGEGFDGDPDSDNPVAVPLSGEASKLGALAPVQCGYPINGDSAVNVDWVNSKFQNTMISGPHGPLSFYETITASEGSSTLFGVCLHHTCQVPGISQVIVSGYSQIRDVNLHSRASLSSFIYPYGRWHDNKPFAFTNGNSQAQARHTETKKSGITSGDYGYRSFTISAYFQNRPGQRCSLGMQANTDFAPDNGASAQFGHMRLTIVVYPNATYGAEDESSWGEP